MSGWLVGREGASAENSRLDSDQYLRQPYTSSRQVEAGESV